MADGAAAGADAGAGGTSVIEQRIDPGAAAGSGAAAGAAGAGAGAAAGTEQATGGRTIADGATGTAGAVALPQTWPEDWRTKLAGDDKAFAKDLERFTDPAALSKAWKELRTERDSGKVRPVVAPPGANATPEQVAEWRKGQGLPDKAADFVEKISLADGLVIGEAEKPLVDAFAEMAHTEGWTQTQFNQAVGKFYQMAEAQEALRAQNDSKFHVDSEVTLRTEWGNEFDKNVNAFGALRDSMPEDLRTLLFSARTDDGKLIGDHPAVIKWGAQIMRTFNPEATIVTANPGNPAQGVADEIATLKASMYNADGSPNAGYWKDEGKQARFRELVDAQNRMQSRQRV